MVKRIIINDIAPHSTRPVFRRLVIFALDFQSLPSDHIEGKPTLF